MHSNTIPTPAPTSYSALSILGLKLMMISRPEIIADVVESVRDGRAARVINANAHCITLAQKQPWMASLFREAEIAFCDGAGVQLASLFLCGQRLPRTTPPEWVGPVLKELKDKASVFWLGGDDTTVSIAARAYAQRFGCKTAGTQHGFFDASPGSAESEAVLRKIAEARPNILLLNMGMPRQERWLWDNWHRLPPMVAITAGALVDHAAGRVRRPPRWVANMGLEWAVRLFREPTRLWRRYVLGLPQFALYVLRAKFRAAR